MPVVDVNTPVNEVSLYLRLCHEAWLNRMVDYLTILVEYINCRHYSDYLLGNERIAGLEPVTPTLGRLCSAY